MSTVSMEDSVLLSSEGSNETDLELGLGLSLGCGDFKFQFPVNDCCRRILGSPLPACSSTSFLSKFSRGRFNVAVEDSDAKAPNCAACSQVIGWPPVRAYRRNNIASNDKPCNTRNIDHGSTKARNSLFVKVNMDGVPIGRKVDLNSFRCYETLAETLEDMFFRSSGMNNLPGPNMFSHMTGRCSNLLDESSSFVLTYEDKEGDWMLAGDVPWGIFLTSVRRLRIMKTKTSGLSRKSEINTSASSAFRSCRSCSVNS